MPLFPVLFALRIPYIFIAACVRMNGFDMNFIIPELGDMKRVALEPDRLKNGSGSPAIHIYSFSRKLNKNPHMFVAKHDIIACKA